MAQEMFEIGSTSSAFRGIDCGPAFSVTSTGVECTPYVQRPVTELAGELAIQAVFAEVTSAQPAAPEAAEQAHVDVLETAGV